jgi:hypothetical protein
MSRIRPIGPIIALLALALAQLPACQSSSSSGGDDDTDTGTDSDSDTDTDTDTTDSGLPCMGLRAVWAIATDDVWVAGDCGIAARFDGTSWDNDPLPSDFNAKDLWALDVQYVIAVGTDDDREAMAYLHDGDQWSELPTPPASDTIYWGVWGSSADDIWLVGMMWLGFDETWSYLASYRVHFDGTSWVVIESGGTDSDSPRPAVSISGVAGDDVFDVRGGSCVLLEECEPCGAIAHYGGAEWEVVYDPGCEYPFSDVWALEAGIAVAVTRYGRAVRYEEGEELEPLANFEEALYTVWARTTEDVFVAGEEGFVARYDMLRALHGLSTTTGQDGWANDVYAVGGEHVGEDDWTGVVFHFDGEEWTEVLSL